MMLFKKNKGDVMTELKSLKNPTRILTALMFLAFIIYSIGINGLSQALPFVPEVVITAIVGAATYAVTQYGTEKRVVRAEELKENEINSDLTEDLDLDLAEDLNDSTSLIDDEEGA